MKTTSPKKGKLLLTVAALVIFLLSSSNVANAWYSESMNLGTGEYSAKHWQNFDTAIQYNPTNGSNANYFQNGFTFHSNVSQTSLPIQTLKLPICNNGGTGNYTVYILNTPDNTYYWQGLVANMNVVATMTQQVAPQNCATENGQTNPAVFTLASPINLSNGGWYSFVILESSVPLSQIGYGYVPPVKWMASEGQYPYQVALFGNYGGYELPLFFWSSYYGGSYYVTSDNCINSDGTTNRTGAGCSGTPLYAPDFDLSNTVYTPLPVGTCGNTPFSCTVGTSVNNVTGTSTYTWNCNAAGGIASCSMPNSYAPSDGVCGINPFTCFSGTSVNNVTGTSTYWWNCNGVSGGANSSCSSVITSTSTITATFPTYTPDSACSILSGDGIIACLKNAFYWAVIPPQDTFKQYVDLSETVSRKPPFGYFKQISTAFSFNSSSSTSTIFVLVAPESPLMPVIFIPLRHIFEIAIYFLAAVWLYNRAKNISI